MAAAISEPKTKRRAFSLEFKLGVLEWMKNGNMSIRGTARKFGIHRRMVQRWKEREVELARAFMTNGAHKKKIHLHNQALFQQLEDKLSYWLNNLEKESGKVICDRNIRSCALSIAKDIGLDGFKASTTWVVSFKERHHFKANANTHDLSTICSSFLSQTNPNEPINLESIEGHTPLAPSTSPPSFMSQTNHLIYFDYQTPEHNYCITPDSAQYSTLTTPTTPVYTIRLSERTYDNSSSQSLLSSDLWHHGQDEVLCNVKDDEIISSPRQNGGDETHTMIGTAAQDFTGTSLSLCTDPPTPIDGVLTIATRTYQPEFTIGPELVYPFGQS